MILRPLRAQLRRYLGRQALPAHLPRIEHRHEPESCACGQCGQDLVLIGEDVSEQLDIEPARFFVHRHIRPQYACRACATVTAAPIPPAVIDGGLAAVGLLAWVVVGKYLDHLPLYRLEGIAARAGVTLARSTLADWVGRLGVSLNPLAERLAELLRQRAVLHADETPVRQLDPGSGKTHRAYLWAYRSNVFDTGPPIVVFDYQTSRSGSHARHFLDTWRGSLMVDDFSGYKGLFADGVTELACMAHARRKFFDLNEAQANPIAQEALVRIAALYEIERCGRDLLAQFFGELTNRNSVVFKLPHTRPDIRRELRVHLLGRDPLQLEQGGARLLGEHGLVHFAECLRGFQLPNGLASGAGGVGGVGEVYGQAVEFGSGLGVPFSLDEELADPAAFVFFLSVTETLRLSSCPRRASNGCVT